MLANHDVEYVRFVWLVASVFGAAALVTLGLIYRSARQRHEIEEAERVIREDDQSS